MFGDLLEKNPKSVSFVLGVVVTLVLLLLFSVLFKEYFTPVSGSWKDEMALLQGVVNAPNPATSGVKKLAKEVFQDPPPQAQSDPRFFLNEAMKDNDDKATELLQSRGGASRAIMDGQRARYMGLTKLGGLDYEGYKWDGQPSNDENGWLHAQAWGITETRDF